MIAARAAWTVVAVSALVGWWAAPLPEADAALVKPRQDSWRLVELPRRSDATATAALVISASYWGRAAVEPNAVQPAVDPRWRVAALYGVGRERTVLVQFASPNRPALRLHVGDKLPSGHTIVEIADRDLCIRIGNRTYRLGVERSES